MLSIIIILMMIIRSKLVNERINVVILDDRKKRSERERIGSSGEAMVEEVLTRCVVRQDGSKKRGLNGNCRASRVLELCDQIRCCHGNDEEGDGDGDGAGAAAVVDEELSINQSINQSLYLSMYLNNLYIITCMYVCMVWYGMVCYAMVWYGMGMVWYGDGMGWDASLDKMNEHLTHSLPPNSNS